MTIHLLAGIFFIALIGFVLTCKILPELAFPEKLAVSFGLGLGVVIVLFGTILFFEILYFPIQLLLILGFFFLSICLLLKPSTLKKNFQNNSPHSLYVCIFVIAALTLISLAISSWYPIFVTDGTDYEMTGKLISLNKNLDSGNYMRAYPPLVVLSYAYVYFLGGTDPKFLFSLLYVCLCIIFYWRLIDFGISRKLASSMTLIMGTTPIIWWHSFLGLLNFTATFYFACASLYWFSYLKKNLDDTESGICNLSYLVIAGIFYGLAIFTRPEFLAYFLIPLIQVVYFHKDSQKFTRVILSFLSPPIVFGILWGVYFFYLSVIMKVESPNISPLTYLVILLFTAILPILFKSFSRSRFFHLLDKKNDTIFYIRYFAISLILVPAFSYLLVEIAEPQLSNDLFIKSLFYLKVFFAMSSNVILLQLFFSMSSLLILFSLPLFIRLLKENPIYRYLLSFVILAFFQNAVIFSITAFHLYPNIEYTRPSILHDIIFISKVIFTYPGILVNNTQTRSLSTFIPILLLISAFVLQNKEKIAGNSFIYKKCFPFLYFIICSNLLILVIFFMTPRVQFMVSNWGENRNQLLLSSGSRDTPNMPHLRNIYKALIEVENQSTDDNPVFLVNPKFSKAEALKILFPRKVYFGAQEIENLKNDINRGSNRPDCYSFSFIGQKHHPVDIDRRLCRNFKHITIEKSESHLSKLNELR